MVLPRFAIYLPILYIIYYFADKYFLPLNYVFEPEKLQQLSQEAIASNPGNTSAIFEHLVQALRTEYGTSLVNRMEDEKWVFNNAGGAMGAMLILHASISEYLILFGTPVGTEGHSGIHMAHDYFTILSGYQHRHDLGNPEPRVFLPGEMNYMARGDVSQYAMKGWALEYARGWIPAMLPFGFLDTFTSTLDVINLWWTVWRTAVNMVGNLLVGKF